MKFSKIGGVKSKIIYLHSSPLNLSPSKTHTHKLSEITLQPQNSMAASQNTPSPSGDLLPATHIAGDLSPIPQTPLTTTKTKIPHQKQTFKKKSNTHTKNPSALHACTHWQTFSTSWNTYNQLHIISGAKCPKEPCTSTKKQRKIWKFSKVKPVDFGLKNEGSNEH